jgi:hypothetical protein
MLDTFANKLYNSLILNLQDSINCFVVVFYIKDYQLPYFIISVLLLIICTSGLIYDILKNTLGIVYI